MAEKQSVGKFRCCKKEMSCYYCLTCQLILHRSCTDRKAITIIKDNKIYCSNSCRDSINDAGDEVYHEIIELRKIITEQQGELDELKQHLKRSKRNSTAFESAVEESEEMYKKEIEEHKTMIESLKTKMEENSNTMKELNLNNKELMKKRSDEKLEFKQKLKRLQNNLAEEKAAKDGAVNTIERMKTENAKLKNTVDGLVKNCEHTENEKIKEGTQRICELETVIATLETTIQEIRRKEEIKTMTLKEEISGLKSYLEEINSLNGNLKKSLCILEGERDSLINTLHNLDTEMKEKNTAAAGKHKKPQVLLLDGPYGYNNGKIFKSISRSLFDTNCQSRESGLFEDITASYSKLTKSFTRRDYVIIFCSSDNARSGKHIKKEDVKSIIHGSKNTNLIMVGALNVDTKPALSKLVEQQNQLIQDCIDVDGSLNSKYLDCGKLIKPYMITCNGTLTGKGRYTVLNYIYRSLINRKTVATMTDDTEKSETITAQESIWGREEIANRSLTRIMGKHTDAAETREIATTTEGIREEDTHGKTDFLYPRLSQLIVET